MIDTNLAIVLGLTWEYIPRQFFESWIQMSSDIERNRIKYSVVLSTRGRADDLRNSAINTILKDGSFDKVLFLDIDHRHKPDTISRLLSHNLPIVSGLSFRRSEPYDPIMFKQVGDKFENITKWNKDEVVEVDAVGAASLLVDVNVFKEIESPWFEMNYPFGKGVVSEDFAFCLKAKDKGHKVYVDTSCTNNHLGNLEINQDTWERFNGL